MGNVKKQLIIFFLSAGFVFGLSAKKEYVCPKQYLEDCFILAKNMYEDGLRPTFLIALWRGGAPVGMVVDEYFTYKNAAIKQHLAMRTSVYHGDELQDQVIIYNLDYVLQHLSNEDTLLIVDDVVDSGKTLQAVLKEINEKCGANKPKEIKIAAVYYKPKTASITPDYYLYETDLWLVFPHEIEGLSVSEVEQHKSAQIAGALK